MILEKVLAEITNFKKEDIVKPNDFARILNNFKSSIIESISEYYDKTKNFELSRDMAYDAIKANMEINNITDEDIIDMINDIFEQAVVLSKLQIDYYEKESE